MCFSFFFFFSSRRRHTRCSRDWSSDVCSSDLERLLPAVHPAELPRQRSGARGGLRQRGRAGDAHAPAVHREGRRGRSEEHTSELQSRLHLVCRLLLEKKKKITTTPS